MKLLLFLLFCFSLNGFSQNNTQIKGVIYSSDSVEVIPFATVWLTTKTDTFLTKSDIKGQYMFKNLEADTFDLRVESLSMGRRIIKRIILKPSELLCLNVFSGIQLICNGCCKMICLRPSNAYPIGDENTIKITRKDILNLKTIEINDRIISLSSDFHENDNQIFVRGTRFENIVYYVDGIRQSTTPNLPRVAINSIRFNFGGLPASFGDTTSGAISIFTVGYFDLYTAWRAKQ